MAHDTKRLTREESNQPTSPLTQTEQKQLLEELNHSITQGPVLQKTALQQLDSLSTDTLTQLKTFQEEEDNMLQKAAIHRCGVEVISQLANNCPALVTRQSKGEYKGRTVLHILVSNYDLDAVTALLESIEPSKKVPKLMKVKATGSAFTGTVMMGQLPLSIAALTFYVEMVELLLENGAKLYSVNSLGDTVLHSLVRFAGLFPEKQEEVMKMMRKIHEKIDIYGAALSSQADAKTLWMMENKKGLTVLRLAAELAVPSVLKLVLGLGGVYCTLDRHDGLFNFLCFDLTEIDPVARQQWRTNNDTTNKSRSACSSDERDRSVLEIICETRKLEKACQMLDTPVIRSIIKSKWTYYKTWFIITAFFHVAFMILLTTYAIYKARVISDFKEMGQPSNSTEKQFLDGISGVAFLVALVLVLMETIRWWQGLPLKLSLHHHNGLYRVELGLLAFSLMVDSIWYWVSGPDNNYFLILALLIGWWFTAFFLRPFKKFSFFTVMLSKVLVGDMLRFSSIIVPELLAFSVAMQITFEAAPGPLPDSFSHLGITILTMFKLMLGLEDFGVLSDAAHPWLAVTLFILFVITNNILMINTLIAMMSATCSFISENKVRQWELQRLSVVLFMEASFPCVKFKHNSGEIKGTVMYDLKRKTTKKEDRYFIKAKSPVPTRDNSGAVCSQKSLTESNENHSQMTILVRDLLGEWTYQRDHQDVLNESAQQKSPTTKAHKNPTKSTRSKSSAVRHQDDQVAPGASNKKTLTCLVMQMPEKQQPTPQPKMRNPEIFTIIPPPPDKSDK